MLSLCFILAIGSCSQISQRLNTCELDGLQYLEFLYPRLQTGHIMVWWCPSVRVSVHLFDSPSDRLRPGLRPSVRLSVCLTPSGSPSIRPTLRPSGSPSASFPHFSPTCWNIAYDFVLLYYRSSSSVVNLHQSLWELCPFWNLEYWKYTVFQTFLLRAFTYWAEILHMTLFYCTTD